MPIEIRELIIKATVGGSSQQNGQTEKPEKKQEIIAEEIIEKTLEILKRKKER
jgi:hypothetical protein